MAFDKNELQAIVRICDMATRYGGLDSINLVVPIAQKAQQEIQAMEMAEKAATEPLTGINPSGRRKRGVITDEKTGVVSESA